MMWLLTAWGGVKRISGIAMRYPWQTALIITLLACLWFYNARQDALATIAKRDATIVQMEAASKIATAAQKALNKQVTDQQTQIAKDADNDQTTRSDIADRSSRYADGMRADGYCRKASAASEDNSPQDRDPASADAVVLSRADFDTLTDNTARLAEVHEWGLALIQADLAVPVE